jgi:hypothetical protein
MYSGSPEVKMKYVIIAVVSLIWTIGGVSQEVFETIDRLWGPHYIDWFASSYNKKLDLFCCRYCQTGYMCIDAL